MTYQELQQAVFREFGYQDSPSDTSISTRIKGYLNDRHRRILSRPGMGILREETMTFSCVAAQAVYALQPQIQKILKVVDTTQRIPLVEQTLDWYRNVDPVPNQGTPQFWIPIGVGPAQQDFPSTGSKNLYVVSANAGDTTQTFHVEWLDDSGDLQTATGSLNGTTRVAVNTGGTASRVIRLSISAAAAGIVSLYDASSNGNIISQILIGRTTAQFYRVALYLTPSSTDSIRVDYIHAIRDMSSTFDEPQLPVDFHYLVALGAKIDEARKRDDDRVTDFRSEYEQGLRELLYFATNPPMTVPGRQKPEQSNLGPWFPSGVW